MSEFAYFLAYHENITHCKECHEEELPIKDYIASLPSEFNNLVCWSGE